MAARSGSGGVHRRAVLPKNVGPRALLTVSFVVSLCLIALLSYQAVSSLLSAQRHSEQYLPAERLAGEIVYYDELLTQSSRLATTTADPAWNRRYEAGVVDLDRTIAETRALGDSGLFELEGLDRVEDSNQWLIDTEREALALAEIGRTGEARQLLFGDEYQVRKDSYASGLDELRSAMRSGVDDGVSGERRTAAILLIASLIALVSSIFVFVWSTRALRRWQERVSMLEGQRQVEVESLAEARFRELAQSSSDIAMVIDEDCQVSYVGAAITSVLQWDVDRIVGTDLSALVHPDDVSDLSTLVEYVCASRGETMSCELRMRTADDRWRIMEVNGRDRRNDDRVDGVIVNAHDVTERAHAQQRAQELLQAEVEHSQRFRYQAEHDHLTGLANRVAFQRHLKEALESDPSQVCLLMIDIDGFKDVNDTRGHQAGDRVLQTIAERLTTTLRQSDVVARIGGDEFAVILQSIGASTVDYLTERLLLAISVPIADESGVIEMSASIGIAGPGFDTADPEVAMGDADLAMYDAKESGRNAVVRFRTAMREEFVARVELKSELQSALYDGDFVVHYQPVWDLATGEVNSVEALVRWDHPTRGMLAPAHFLPAAEESGLVGDIDLFVLGQACRQLSTWRASGNPSLQALQIGVNMSALDLSTVGLVDTVADEIAANQIDPSNLVIEITETAMMENIEVAKSCLKGLSLMGIRLALDDFGTGYSSLIQLQTIAFDVLKIDRAFVAAEDTPSQASVLETIVALAHLLDLSIVAEGIETKEQLTRMRRLGCDFGQGYLMAKPMSVEAVTELVIETAQMLPRESHWL